MSSIARTIHRSLRAYYLKQDIELTEELDFALRDMAEYLASQLAHCCF